jgi:hypothetical protein
MMTITGCVDCITSTEVCGWAYREDDPKQHVIVSIRHKRRKLGSTVANEFRSDLRRAGIGAGDHAFLIAFSPPLSDAALCNAVVVASAPGEHWAELPISEESRADRHSLARANSTIKPVTQSQLRMLLRYGTIYAESADLRPPVGLPADFIDQRILDEYFFWTETEPEEIKMRIIKDTIPVPHSDNREGYAAGRDLLYWLSGYGDYRRKKLPNNIE